MGEFNHDNPYQDYPYTHSDSHRNENGGGSDPLFPEDFPHALLESDVHTDTTSGTPVRGDIIIAMTSSPKWGRYALITPAANVRNALAVDNGEVEPTWKATLDSTAPTTIAAGDAATAGTSLIYSHRDHRHGSPTTYPPTAHNLLSASHGDTTAGTVQTGDLIAGISGTWQRFAKPASASILMNDGTNIVWNDGSWNSVSYAAGDFTASSGSWTVDSGDVTTYAYQLFGKTMFVSFYIIGTDVSATPVYLYLAIPAGRTAAKYMVNPGLVSDAGTIQFGVVSVVAGATVIGVAKLGGAAWTTTAADNTSVFGQITFEVQ